MTSAKVRLWGRDIAAVVWDNDSNCARFQYNPDFARSGIEISPIMMPLGNSIYQFPQRAMESFKGLPGLLADSLPDKFGNALIDAYLAKQGRAQNTFNPVERLCYIGKRGMGALEFMPMLHEPRTGAKALVVDALIRLAEDILLARSHAHAQLTGAENLADLLRVGISAGGARAKAIIAWNPATNEVRSGQVQAPEGFIHYLIKFDGVGHNGDKESADAMGYGRIEYAYYLMATAAHIKMMPCELLEENGRAHFMTQRFDRTSDGQKLHMQTLGGLMHYDLNMAGAHSYEQAIACMRALNLSQVEITQFVRRALFNIFARNQDDHVKNISFLMNKAGHWSLAPAYDINFAFNPNGAWTSQHQMTLNSKRDNFDHSDFLAFARYGNVKPAHLKRIISEISQALSQWPVFARQAGVPANTVSNLSQQFRAF